MEKLHGPWHIFIHMPGPSLKPLNFSMVNWLSSLLHFICGKSATSLNLLRVCLERLILIDVRRCYCLWIRSSTGRCTIHPFITIPNTKLFWDVHYFFTQVFRIWTYGKKIWRNYYNIPYLQFTVNRNFISVFVLWLPTLWTGCKFYNQLMVSFGSTRVLDFTFFFWMYVNISLCSCNIINFFYVW